MKVIEEGKAVEKLWRKAIGPVKWQPVAKRDMVCTIDFLSVVHFVAGRAEGFYKVNVNA